ncbi:cold-shock protein [Litchfieldia salsa]|uniref:Cold-inducible protein YdjO n=1 Tax=Litchfieldia salsa TaxID=930152 RepID=A0A1H0TCS5_9BACI|nr:cold-shock protein [Litchfieldia salsa]SDP51842.1 Cold-inducible protein YdjO [Litchfieldia salsa]
MAFGRKPEVEIIKEDIKVWECSSDDCNCWVRDNFKSSAEEPTCPICHSEMSATTKSLQAIQNHATAK